MIRVRGRFLRGLCRSSCEIGHLRTLISNCKMRLEGRPCSRSSRSLCAHTWRYSWPHGSGSLCGFADGEADGLLLACLLP